MTMTFDEYDKMIERFEQMKTEVAWPTYEQIQMFESNPDKWILYCCYILEKAEAPKEQKDKYSKSNLQTFVNNNLELVEE